jgi:formamidopyrimidine-DNA glycosylase
VVAVTVHERRLRGGVAAGFCARLLERRIVGVTRRGKYVLLALDDGRIWLVHLGMTGQLTIASPERAARRHDHVVVTLDDGRLVTYNDARRFGRVAVIEAGSLAAETGEGIEPLGPTYTADALFALTRRRKTSVKAFLMDQRRIAGLGNIYVNEILFHAGVRPRRRASRLARAECARIVTATRTVLAAAIERGGSSISDYRDGLGRTGRFQLEHQVYDRAGQGCRQCGSPIRSFVVVGRSTFYCPRCQL